MTRFTSLTPRSLHPAACSALALATHRRLEIRPVKPTETLVAGAVHVLFPELKAVPKHLLLQTVLAYTDQATDGGIPALDDTFRQDPAAAVYALRDAHVHALTTPPDLSHVFCVAAWAAGDAQTRVGAVPATDWLGDAASLRNPERPQPSLVSCLHQAVAEVENAHGQVDACYAELALRAEIGPDFGQDVYAPTGNLNLPACRAVHILRQARRSLHERGRG